jgi:hypothetical protein
MSGRYLKYQLQNGFVNNWLVAGPLQRPVSIGNAQNQANELKVQIAREMDDPAPGYAETPVDWQSFNYAGETLTWHYFHCAEDHLVDVSAVYPTWTHARTWAYSRLILPKALPAATTLQFSLTVPGPAQVWLNGKQVFKVEDFNSEAKPVLFNAELDLENDLLVRFEQVGVRQCENWMALQVASLPEGFKQEDVLVLIPTDARFPHRHQKFETMLEKAYLEEVANHRGMHVILHWAEDTSEEMHYAYSIQDAQERIYVEGTWDPDTKEPLDIGHPQRIFERPMWVVLRAPGKEYYEQNMRYERRLPMYILDNEYSDRPYGDLASRRQEALLDASRREGHLFGEIAKMVLEKWDKLDAGVIRTSIASVNRREADSLIQVAGLLTILFRFMEGARFSDKLAQAMEACLLGYPYWADEPGTGGSALDFIQESQAILFHACEILAGQLYPERVFENSGMKGSDHRAKGEQLALDWLRKRGRGGFMEWDSNSAFELNIAALALLTSLAESEPVRELSAVVLDKILFLIAVNSYKGAYGSTHGSTRSAMVKSAQLEATSGITRLLWGVGVYSQSIVGTVSLVCSEYEYPSFFADLATHLPEEMWSKERQVSDADAGPDVAEVNKVTYKTRHYMLSSAQDYRPGQPGNHEHIWQATMGPDAVVFANHPACMSENEAHQPGFWLGNGVLPRVAQWKDVLISVHNLPETDRMGFTHAYFPTFAFDEYQIEGGWAFARLGKGYLAITAMQGLELVKHGPDGYRELRSYGRNNLWVCHMGRDQVDGYFNTYKQEIQKIKPDWQDLSVRFTSLRGEELAFGWAGPLLVNGQEQPITGFKHIENPYCTADLPADSMDIRYEDLLLRLNFQ